MCWPGLSSLLVIAAEFSTDRLSGRARVGTLPLKFTRFVFARFVFARFLCPLRCPLR